MEQLPLKGVVSSKKNFSSKQWLPLKGVTSKFISFHWFSLHDFVLLPINWVWESTIMNYVFLRYKIFIKDSLSQCPSWCSKIYLYFSFYMARKIGKQTLLTIGKQALLTIAFYLSDKTHNIKYVNFLIWLVVFCFLKIWQPVSKINS